MKITLDGYFNQNLGDDLFFTLIANRYSQHEFYAWSWYELPVAHHNLHARYNRLENRLSSREKIEKRRFKDTDLLIEAGGSIFMEGISQNQDWSRSGKPFYILGASFGPYQSQSYLQAHETLFSKAEDVCFRDNRSRSLFYGKNIRKQADLAFLLGKEKRFQTLWQSKKKQLLISVMHFENEASNKAYLFLIQKQIDLFKDQGYEIVLAAFHPLQNDEKDFDLLTNYDRTISYNGKNLDAFLKETAQSEAVIATRFHSIVLGLIFKAKVLPILYGQKSESLLKDLGFEPLLYLEKLDQISEKKIESAWISLSEGQIEALGNSAEKQFQVLDETLKKQKNNS